MQRAALHSTRLTVTSIAILPRLLAQDAVGRILKTLHGTEAGTWFWSCYEGGANGRVSTKDEAAFGVERAFTRRVVKAAWRAM